MTFESEKEINIIRNLITLNMTYVFLINIFLWSLLLDRRVPVAPRYLLDLSAVTPDLEPIPVMETPHILKSLLDTLFSNDELKMWQIYEEHSGNICVKLRFSAWTQCKCSAKHATRYI